MTIGPGQYDDLCTYVREQSGGEAAIVIVIGGSKGNGFSMQFTNLAAMLQLRDVLQQMAKQIRADLRKGTG
jgi:2-phosphoglycerate kinase